jgi:hypothetical protein
MSDTSSVRESDVEDDSNADEEEIPRVILHPRIGYNVDTTFECPLETLIEHTLAAAQASAQQGCPRCILRVSAISEIFPDMPTTAEISCSHNYIFLRFRVQGYRIVLASETQHGDEDQVICDFYGDGIGGIGCVQIRPKVS